jgi:hypothetical protein
VGYSCSGWPATFLSDLLLDCYRRCLLAGTIKVEGTRNDWRPKRTCFHDPTGQSSTQHHWLAYWCWNKQLTLMFVLCLGSERLHVICLLLLRNFVVRRKVTLFVLVLLIIILPWLAGIERSLRKSMDTLSCRVGRM